MDKLVTSINGKIVRRGQDKISVFDNSLLYADGLFEACLAVDDYIVSLSDHLSRLYRGARVMGMKLPVSRRTMTAWVRETVKTHPDRVKKIRITVTAGESARWTGRHGPPQVIISAAPNVFPSQPYRLHLSEFRVDQDSIFRRIKTISYAIHAAALRQARAKKCDDALLINEKGQVAEASSANLYWAKKNRIYTPPLSSGCLDGITRRIVIRDGHRYAAKVVEKNGTLTDLIAADEVFITSSLKLVVPVISIKAGQHKYSFQPGPLTEELHGHFVRQAHL
jgi:branched-chain amino acid aminotransferase